jgi:hypothetical protein
LTLETCLDDLETSVRGGATVALRSKSPPMVRQEIYAMLCCYQTIRTLISRAAGDSGLGSPPGLLHRGPPAATPARLSAAAAGTTPASPAGWRP